MSFDGNIIYENKNVSFKKGTVFYNENINIQTGTEFGWQGKVVKAGSYFYCAYTINADGVIELRVSKSLDGLSWVDANFPQTLRDGNSNLWASMAVDNNNKIHLCFIKDGYNNIGDGTAKVVYTTYIEGVGWSVFEELNPIGYYYGFPVITIDKNDKPHISYGNLGGEQEIFYTNKISGSWLDWDELSNGLIIQEYFTNIFVDSNNIVSIFYYASDVNYENYGIYRTYGVAESWNTELIIDSDNVFYFDVEIDNNENFHIVGHNLNNDKLEYYKKVSGEFLLIASSEITWSIPWTVNISIINNIIHVVYDDSKSIGFGEWENRNYYTKITNDNFSNLLKLDTNGMGHSGIYADENNILIVLTDYDNFEYIYSYHYSNYPILIPAFRGRIMICEYQGTMSAEAGTSSTAIIATAHNLNDADMIVNSTRKGTSLKDVERGSRKIVKHDDDTLLLSDGVPIIGQTTGDEIKLYKYIDRTDMVKIGSLNIKMQNGNKSEANLQLIIPIED